MAATGRLPAKRVFGRRSLAWFLCRDSFGGWHFLGLAQWQPQQQRPDCDRQESMTAVHFLLPLHGRTGTRHPGTAFNATLATLFPSSRCTPGSMVFNTLPAQFSTGASCTASVS